MTEVNSILLELAEYLDAQDDLSDGVLTEAEDDKKDEVPQGIINKLKALFKSLKDAVVKIVKDITEYFRYKMLSAEDKVKLNELKRRVKEHPELGNVEVTVIDYKKYEKVFNDALNRLEADMKKENSTEKDAEESYNWLVKSLERLKDDATKNGKTFATRVTLATALDLADTHQTAATVMNTLLKREIVQLDEIDNNLSEKEISNYRKKVEKYAKDGFFHKVKIRMLRRHTDTFRDVMDRNINNLLNMTNLKMEDNKIKKRDTTKKGISGFISEDDVIRGINKNRKYSGQVFGGHKGASSVSMAARGLKEDRKNIVKTAKEEKRFWSLKSGKKK